MKYHREKIGRWVFIMISALLYLGFMLCDIFFRLPQLSTALKFASIVICFLATLMGVCLNCKNEDRRLLSGAFTFTVTADVFLLLSDHYELGVLSFCLVQTIYLLRIVRIRRHYIKTFFLRHLFVRIVAAAAVLSILKMTSVEVDFLLCITVFYFLSFVENIVLLGSARIWEYKSQKSEKRMEHKHAAEVDTVNIKLFLLGMILFILCDVSVGLYNLTDYINISDSAVQFIDDIISLCMWGFYLPGQVCIVLSAKNIKE